jgi:hypothetical protein
MTQHRKATDEQIVAAYRQNGDVWRAAKALGMCGQSVHERLVRLGEPLANPAFTEADAEVLRADYTAHANAGTLADLAARMGRTKQFLCRQARKLGLTNKGRGKPWLLARVHAPGGLALTRQWRRKRLRIGEHTRTFRSGWEANYARLLQWRLERGEIRDWEHEPETVWLASGVSYLPDFRVVMADGSTEYHEVKGYLDARSAAKVAGAVDALPGARFVLVDTAAYRALSVTHSGVVPGWEPDQAMRRTAKGQYRALVASLM